ncbi:hypothetical protein [Paraburkholderia adhaesiva]|uniref:hypothetical protein n=1 Tax=Paraburkholderia adhaesiva TaxID=2883244 RepID=UPI001F1736D7|nr:hypothetical protein [Paraburkholderia adhaesiva]
MRLAAVDALARASLAVRGEPVTLHSPGDWNPPADRLPAVFVRTGRETKTSFNRGLPEFTTECALEVKAIVKAPTAAQAQDDIEALWFAIENALLLDPALIAITQQFASVETALDIRAEGARHLAGIAASFAAEFPEMFDPAARFPALAGVGLHADTIRPADPSGTYVNPPFPASVTPAPRTHGPDGRDEATLVVLPPRHDGQP